MENNALFIMLAFPKHVMLDVKLQCIYVFFIYL